MAEHIGAVGSECEISADLHTGSQIRTHAGCRQPSFKQFEHKLCYRSERDTGDRDLACRGADGQSLRRRGRGE
jgi:hypothetical protein